MAVLAPFALAACDAGGGEPEPKFTDSSSAASTESSATDEPSPSGPVEPTLPAEAEEATKAGAEAFVRYFWEIVNYAQKTGDVTTLRRLQYRYCEVCAAGADSIQEIYSRGGHIGGGIHEVRRAQAHESVGLPGSWIVTVQLEVGRQVVRGAGELNGTFPAGRQDLVMTIRHADARWRVASWESD